MEEKTEEMCLWNEMIDLVCVNPMKKRELIEKDVVELSIMCRNCMAIQNFRVLFEILTELKKGKWYPIE